MSQSNMQFLTDAQGDALDFLASVYGVPTYLNARKPAVAIHADFKPCDAYPYGSSWRIEPDGAIDDITAALLGESE